MSHEAVLWTCQLPMSACTGTAFRVLVNLAERADALGYGAWPAVTTLANTLECSTRTVQRALRELVEAGLIRVGDQSAVEHLRHDRRPTVYDVLTPALRYIESGPRGDIRVTPPESRGDIYGPHGVTTVVARTTHEPSYQDSISHLSYLNARESVMTK
jgi:DNA-binding MarR family transcriptional regulator